MNKITVILLWALCILIGLLFISSGYPKIVAGEAMIQRFRAWGYGPLFMKVIGVLELVGGALLLVPKARFLASISLSIVMIGAVFTHLYSSIGSPWFAIGTLLGLLLIIYLLRKDRFPMRSINKDAQEKD